jgi:DNA-binding MarR family transcriptional regulator
MSANVGGHEVAMTLRRAYLAMHRQTDAALRASGVTADQFVVLCALAEGDALTQRELVDRTSSDPNTHRAILVLLERRRLVRRTPHPVDGRARSVALTAKGRTVFQKLWRESDDLRQSLIGALAPGGAEPLVAQLKQIISAIESDQEANTAGTSRVRAGLAASAKLSKQTQSLPPNRESS